jgi:hypothetical protein
LLDTHSPIEGDAAHFRLEFEVGVQRHLRSWQEQWHQRGGFPAELLNNAATWTAWEGKMSVIYDRETA